MQRDVTEVSPFEGYLLPRHIKEDNQVISSLLDGIPETFYKDHYFYKEKRLYYFLFGSLNDLAISNGS